MNARILLCISRAGACLAHWQRGGLHDWQTLPADAEGWAQLDAALRARPGLPVHVAVDSVEEYYRSEALPRARFRDRREMTRRRLQQLLPQTPYRAVLPQGPAGEGLVGDRYLFMGLTAPALLQPWLEVLRLHGAPLAGVWLAPVFGESLLAELGLLPRGSRHLSLPGQSPREGSDRLLLVLEQGGGLRLSYFRRGRLQFSRLVPLEPAAQDDPEAVYAEQIERTRQALLGQRLLGRGETLSVRVVDAFDALEGVCQRLPEAAGCAVIPRGRLLGLPGLSPELLNGCADALNLALLARAPAAANLLPDEMRRPYLHARMARSLRHAAGLWLAASLGLSLALGADAWRLGHAADRLEDEVQKARRQAQALLTGVGGAEAFEALWQVHLAWQAVQARLAHPARDLGQVAAAAGPQTGIRLSRLRWEGPGPDRPRKLNVEGEIAVHGGDYRSVHARLQALASELGRQGWQVDITRWPLDPDPNRTLQGEFTPEVPLTADFALELAAATRRGPPAQASGLRREGAP